MVQLAEWMAQVAAVRADAGMELDDRRKAYREIAAAVRELCNCFPAPGLLYGAEGKPM